MLKIDRNLLDIGMMDTLAMGDSPLHRLDPRAKLIATMAFIVSVVSFGKYELTALLPFFAYPLIQVTAGGLPPSYLARKVLIVSPFALFVGMFNPLMDRDILVTIGDVGISGGWISFVSILLRFTLTVSAALVLISLTGFNSVCSALEKLRVPRTFVVQLLFLYRYIFVLVEEAARMSRARALRSFDSRGMGFKPFVSLLGNLLLRTLDRAQRIHTAMCCRGFDGHVPALRPMRFGAADLRHVLFWTALFAALRFYNPPLLLGLWITGLFR